MTDEQKKKADETAKAEAEAKAKEEADAEFEASIESLSDEEKEAKRAERDGLDNDSEIDYEAELAKEKERADKAEKALAEKRFNASEKKRKAKEENGEEDEGEDKPLSSSELQRILAEDRQQNQKVFQQTQARELAKKLGKSEAEINLILTIHENRTFPPDLSLEEQIEESYVIANRKKIIGENSELRRALRGRNGINNNPAGSHHDPLRSPTPKLNAADDASYKRAGFTFDTKDKLWKKKLANGKFLIKNPSTKQTYLSK